MKLITKEMDVALVEVNDGYQVDLWQFENTVSYTTDEARELAASLVAAADEADEVEAKDRAGALGSQECVMIAPNGEHVI